MSGRSRAGVAFTVLCLLAGCAGEPVLRGTVLNASAADQPVQSVQVEVAPAFRDALDTTIITSSPVVVEFDEVSATCDRDLPLMPLPGDTVEWVNDGTQVPAAEPLTFSTDEITILC